MPKLAAATSTTGFFQPQPLIPNQYDDDVALRRAVSLFTPDSVLSSVHDELQAFSDRILSKEVMEYIVNAEHDLPYVSGSGFTSFGHPNGDSLVTSWGWRALQDIGFEERIVRLGYERQYGAYTRLLQLYKLHLWNPSSVVVTCPSSMQDGAVSCLLRALLADKNMEPTKKRVFERALERLLSTDPKEAWTSGQWMTERPGGSDVRGTETIAHQAPAIAATDIDGLPLGPWEVNGFKWFSSATDCGCVVLLAKTDKGGLSCFFAPTRRIVNGRQEMNGIRIQRLKNKLGTKALPTAEVEVKGLRAYLIGEEGRGIPVIATLLNVTRFYNAVSSVAFFGRALGIVRAFARVRTFPSLQPPNNLLIHRPLFAKSLAAVALQYRADLALTCFVAALLGASDSGQGTERAALIPSDGHQVQLLLRVLTPVMKAYTAKNAIYGVQECMESLGGVGYMENVENPEMNIARIFRDTNVLSIWEGTTDVLASDTVKVITGRDGSSVLDALNNWITFALSKPGFDIEKDAIKLHWLQLGNNISDDKEEALADGRATLRSIAETICATLLVADAERDHDVLAIEVAKRFVAKVFRTTASTTHDWHNVTKMDQMIAFAGNPGNTAKL